MIKKYMNQLYKEVEQLRRKLISGKMKYFAHKKEFANANNYVVLLKNGSYFYINIGTNNIPKLHKKDIAYIYKEFNIDFNSGRIHIRECLDSDSGRIVFDSNIDRYARPNYVSSKYKKYNIDLNSEIDTGCFD